MEKNNNTKTIKRNSNLSNQKEVMLMNKKKYVANGYSKKITSKNISINGIKVKAFLPPGMKAEEYPDKLIGKKLIPKGLLVDC